MSTKTLYRVTFLSQGKVYEIYTRRVSDAGMLGFVQIDELVFGERSGVVVDPGEERIKAEFAGVQRSFLPMHSIVRIDEVSRHGTSKVSKAEGDNVARFPAPVYPPGSDTRT